MAGSAPLANAKLVLVLYAPLALAMWYPFWKRRKLAFALVGTLYFVCALAFDGAVDFEGGLLFCWVATLAVLIGDPKPRWKELAWVLPLGVFIRPDVALPVLAVTAVLLGRELIRRVVVASLIRGALMGGVWCVLCWFMQVWPIPMSYWTKAAIPNLFDEKFLVEVFFERIGWVTGFRFLGSPAMATFLGILIVFGFLLAMVRDGRTRIAAFAAVAVGGMLFTRTPANFWWYYQNFVMLMLGAGVGVLAKYGVHGILPNPGAKAAGVFVLLTVLTLMAGRAFGDGPNPWRVDAPSRAQGYMYLGSHAVGDGTYALPGIGTVLIKNPEIGMISYFSGPRAWMWDAAGLAQPLDEKSPLRYFYPARLRESPLQDAQRLASRARKPLRVVEVWAMEDRNFQEARKKARYVIEEGAIMANDYAWTK